MNASRRDLILGTLFGAGHVGLRALATGLPAAAFLRPLRTFGADAAGCADPARAQYLIISTSSAGDPVNANAPGTYDFPDIPHALDPRMEGVDLRLGSVTTRAARVWSTLPQPVLDRTCFFHHATLTNNHPNLPKVMRLMGATSMQEMLPSLIAKRTAPCLGTIQTEPVSVGAGEILTFDGRGLPNLNPTGLRDVLSQPQGPLADLQKLRDSSLDRMYAALRAGGSKPALDYLDRLALSRTQARSIADDLIAMLATIRSDRSDGQVVAAAVLVKMRVSPVVAIHIEFGGDNHSDEDLLQSEVPQTETGVQRIATLMQTLEQYGLSDQVTFAMYNVFGRTLKKLGLAGRDHWASHHTTVMIGKPIRPGVVGGLEPQAGDYYATPIDSSTGRATPGGGDIPFAQTLAAMGKTLAAAAGLDRATIDQDISQGKVVAGALV
jgi:Protein of unknown function (DUF1501)